MYFATIENILKTNRKQELKEKKRKEIEGKGSLKSFKEELLERKKGTQRRAASLKVSRRDAERQQRRRKARMMPGQGALWKEG